MITELLIKAYQTLHLESNKINGVFEIRLPIESTVPVYAGLEMPNDLIRFSFLILEQFKALFNPSQSEGFEVKISDELDQFGFYKVSVVLSESSYYEIFLVLSSDLLEVLSSADTDQKAFEMFINRMDHWRDFLKLSRSRSLSFEEEIGLFGELTILEKLITRNPSLDVLSTWKGPLGKSHDFIRPNLSLEIKTSLFKKKSLLSISSEFQLDGKNLYLGHVVIDDSFDSPKNKSIPDLIEDIEKKLTEDSFSLFRGLVISAGYKIEESEKYRNRKYSTSSIEFYEVTEDFPKITQKNINPKICEVRYKINVGGIVNYAVSLDKLIERMTGAEIGT